MGRTVDEVNESIKNTNSIISSQEALILTYADTIQKNTNECETLRKQKETLENTQVELSNLCNSLLSNSESIEITYGTTNGFAKEFSKVTEERIKSIQTNIINDKLQSMIDRLDYQIGVCENNIITTQSNIDNAQNKISTAQDDLVSYNNELIKAQIEEEATLLTITDV